MADGSIAIFDLLMTEKEIKEKLKLLLWDTPATVDEAYDLLMFDKPSKHISKHNLYQKILNSFRWYVVKQIIPSEKMNYAFSEKVLNGLFPRSIRDNYKHAKRFLPQ